MRVVVLCLMLLASIAIANEQKDTKAQLFELSANNVTSQGNVITAQENAFLLSEDIYMYADMITYNRESKDIALRGNVRVYYGDTLFIDAGNVDINLQTKQASITPAFLLGEGRLWVASTQLSSNENTYSFKKAIISSCDVQFPIWHINATSGSYNTQKQYVSAWNTRLYLGSLPLFYVPYFTFSTGTTRKSGFMPLEFGSTSREGYVFLTPFYIAPFNSWDMTLTPQFRTQRGNGVHYELRIADNKNGIATLNVGYFKQYENYIKTYDLKNKDIYGFDFIYKRDGIFATPFSNYNDNLFADLHYMNDLDYKRLQSVNGRFNTRLSTSRLNYFGQISNHYIGIYGKYFLDLSSPSNANTHQVLPSVQYHHYISPILFNNLFYSLNIESKNITRQSGYTYTQNSLSLPLGVSMPVLKNFANLSGRIDGFASNVSLGNAQNINDPFTKQAVQPSMNYAYANYQIAINSDIAKPYKKFLHTAHFDSQFSAPLYYYAQYGLDSTRYEAYSELAKILSAENLAQYWNPNDIIDIGANKPKADIKLSNYFYSTSGKEIGFYRIYQRIFTNDSTLNANQPLRQEIGVNIFNGLTITSNLFFSHRTNRFNEASLTLNFNKFGLKANANYFFKLGEDTMLKSGAYNHIYSSAFLRANMRYDFGYFTLEANIGYDEANARLKDWSIVFSRDIACFGIGLKFATDVRPIFTNSGIDTLSNQYIKIEFRFSPLTPVGFTQKLQN